METFLVTIGISLVIAGVYGVGFTIGRAVSSVNTQYDYHNEITVAYIQGLEEGRDIVLTEFNDILDKYDLVIKTEETV